METVEVAASESQRRGAVTRLVLAASVLAAVVGFATVDLDNPGWPLAWVRPADHFGPSPGGHPTMFLRADVGDTVTALMTETDEPVHLDEIQPVFADGSAFAAVELVACRRREGAPTPGAVVGEPLSNYCGSVHRPTDLAIGSNADGEVLIVAVVQPLEAGTVFIDGVRVTHSRGPFHRTEHTGAGLEIDVP